MQDTKRSSAMNSNIESIISSLGIEEYDELLPQALEEFAYRRAVQLLCDAKDYANHAQHNEIEDSDISLALKFGKQIFATDAAIRAGGVHGIINGRQLHNVSENPLGIRYPPPTHLLKRPMTCCAGIDAYPDPNAPTNQGPRPTPMTNAISTPKASKIQINIHSSRIDRNDEVQKNASV